ncbi:MAG: hypothetical protein QOF77_2030 [Solirubrobacteraceae bacterium]|jgi:uncharacterized protein YbcI|nr:hypothetical protein [Solirubrobacteraceae bacterium]
MSQGGRQPHVDELAAQRVSDAVARVYLEEFGRGPLVVETSIRGEVVLSVLRGVLGPAEKVLCAAGRHDIVLAVRRLWREATDAIFKEAVGSAVGSAVLVAVSGVQLEHDMATETFILGGPPTPRDTDPS